MKYDNQFRFSTAFALAVVSVGGAARQRQNFWVIHRLIGPHCGSAMFPVPSMT